MKAAFFIKSRLRLRKFFEKKGFLLPKLHALFRQHRDVQNFNFSKISGAFLVGPDWEFHRFASSQNLEAQAEDCLEGCFNPARIPDVVLVEEAFASKPHRITMLHGVPVRSTTSKTKNLYFAAKIAHHLPFSAFKIYLVEDDERGPILIGLSPILPSKLPKDILQKMEGVRAKNIESSVRMAQELFGIKRKKHQALVSTKDCSTRQELLLDRFLTRVHRSLQFTPLITPLNLETEKEAFLQNSTRSPRFVYPKTKLDPIEEFSTESTSVLSALLGRKREELQKKHAVLRNIGTVDFEELGQALYPFPSQDELEAARQILSEKHEIKTLSKTGEVDKFLEQNAEGQVYELFKVGWAGAQTTVKGLDLWNQSQLFGKGVLVKAALHLFVIDFARTHGFCESFDYCLKLGLSPEEAFDFAFESKKGLLNLDQSGAFAEGALPFRGYLQVKNFIAQGGDPRELYLGKFSVEEIHEIKKLPDLQAPSVLPSFLQDWTPRA